MELIREIGIRNNGKRGYMWAEFRCPKCGKIIERMKHQGIRQEQCWECFREYHRKTQIKHGDRYTRLYRIWINMRARCNNPKEQHYKHYGGRGITICEEWNDYSKFKKWALENGYRDDLTIDRIDNNGNYEPSNCRFIPMNINAGKDKIKVNKQLFEKIQKEINDGATIISVCKKHNISYGAYYNAKRRYEND